MNADSRITSVRVAMTRRPASCKLTALVRHMQMLSSLSRQFLFSNLAFMPSTSVRLRLNLLTNIYYVPGITSRTRATSEPVTCGRPRTSQPPKQVPGTGLYVVQLGYCVLLLVLL